ncbi:MAG TPA: Rne/Rng family ribonuclease [Candidatus Binatia bacterium]|nr:Rne/Rng family ribonuclease [Candidatus Binatia bacterium]
MNKELYVSSTPHETKVALMEDDQLAEVFFERENEYTLAGSIYKGRVTRVLPGMQSAFVDIGLERDAFLYVSDFLELSGEEEEEEEFGEIPAPRVAIELGKAQPVQEGQPAGSAVIVGPVPEAESESFGEDFSASAQEQREEEEPTSTEDGEGGDGARRWRGRRRRRGGRRGRGYEREHRAEAAGEANGVTEEAASLHAEPRSRPEHRPAAQYPPIILPGESISKYRNLSLTAAEPEEANAAREQETAPTPVEDFTPVEANPATPARPEELKQELEEQATHLDQGYAPAQPKPVEAAPATEEQQPRSRRRWWSSRRKASEAVAETEPTRHLETPPAAAPQSSGSTEAAGGENAMGIVHANEAPSADIDQQERSEHGDSGTAAAGFSMWAGEHGRAETEAHPETQAAPHGEHEVETPAGNYEPAEGGQHAAPSVAPEGRTLEHEVLEDEEAEFHPMPDDLSAMREVAGDEELVLEEETLDAGNNYSDRWVPQIEDVDEDEVVAAEMRGEKIYEAEEEEENGEEEEAAGRAELRASAPTAGYQQRTAERPGYERRGYRDRDRGRRGGPRRVRTRGYRHQPLITDLLKEGQEVLVQIAKEPIGKKGARITSHIALPGRFLVYMPTVNHVGVSRKISSDEERQRLKRIVTSERENGLGGFIVRTAAANIKEEDLRSDIRFLKHLWSEIRSRAENSRSPALIYHDLNLVERVLRDQVNADFSQIWVDTEDEYERVVRFANRFQPSLVRRIKLYTRDTPLFEEFSIQDEINRSLKSKVWLKSGGHIVINQTEALVAIDVNTGKYVGKTQRLEDTIVKTNVDAIKEIVRQIRLRDLGGIIVIDFIDMDERKNRQKVMVALEEALRGDRAPSKVLQFNDFGLVAITRKRVKQSLERTLGEPCPYCTGAGFVKSVPTVCNELYIEMRKMAKVHDKNDVTVRVNPEVAKALKAGNGKLITELEDLTGKTVLVKSDASLHQEMFDIH